MEFMELLEMLEMLEALVDWVRELVRTLQRAWLLARLTIATWDAIADASAKQRRRQLPRRRTE